MLLSLKDQIADDAANLLLNAQRRDDGFNEQVTYGPSGGTARPIEAILETQQLLHEDQVGDEEQVERVHVFCLRDATKGITEPAVTDTLTRIGDSRPYVFSGQILSANSAAWVLVFWRYLQTGRSARR